MDSEWRTGVGDLRTRDELARLYGGSVYSGGVVPSRKTPNVLLFTDPVEGEKYGYAYDGVAPDRSAYYYTGRGSVGDQTLAENGAIVQHAEQGRALRLFVADGLVPGTSQKYQRYVGAFYLDSVNPYRREPARDRRGATRSVLVFRLLPADAGATESLRVEELAAVDASGTRANIVPLETNSNSYYETAGTAATTASRREAALVARFRAWSGMGDSGVRWAIRTEDGTLMLTDVFDERTGTLYEAKASASRNDVRLAIGQLLDYRRHIRVPGLICATLLPEEPSADLRDLLFTTGIGVVYEVARGFIADFY